MSRQVDFLLALFALLLVFALASCAPLAAAAPTETPVQPTASGAPLLRITNQGPQDLKNLVVLFPDSRIVFGDVPAGTTTEYREAPNGVYNYAAYEYEVDGQQVIQPVIDWVGENPRPGSRFTYVIAYDPEQEQMLAIQLIEVLSE